MHDIGIVILVQTISHDGESMQSDVEKIPQEQGSSVTSFLSCLPWCSPDDQAASSTDSMSACILPPLPVIDEAELSGLVPMS